MKVEVRRNRDVSFSMDLSPENKEAIARLMNDFPKLTPEQQELLDEGKRQREEIERQIWAWFKENPSVDLLGNPITPETHEVGFDVEQEEYAGCMWAVAKKPYIRPKRSEYETNKED